jgi:RNA polymerase sigma factor (sigma-70 family)
LFDVLAGDLVAAGYAVRVDGKQDTHAVPGVSSDLGGRGAGGQPQRQRGMAKVVGAAGRLGACPVFRNGCGAGLFARDTRVPGRSGHFIAGTAPGRRRRARTTIMPSRSITSSMTRDDNPENTIPAVYLCHTNRSLEKSSRRPASVSIDAKILQFPADAQDEPSRRLEQTELRNALSKALADLPPDYRTAIVLRDVEGLSTQEAAEIVGVGQPRSRAACAKRG